ncbi:MAG: response regulator [Candidatus Omnitrophica bacterium]|nr:response regulator [Candidatus Omnitrophota bacterium]
MVKLLIVDDEKEIAQVLSGFFSERGYQTVTAHSGEEALTIVDRSRPHLMFLDLKMPGMSGLEVLKKAHEMDSSLKIIVISADEEQATIEEARSLGASDYVTKPFDLVYLEREVIGKVTSQLYEDLRESYQRLQQTFREIVQALMVIVGKIDPHYTAGHVGRTLNYGAKIVSKLQAKGHDLGGLSDELFLAGVLLHDIGKIFTPREILHKEGPLNEQEWEIMRRHPVDGAQILSQVEGLREMSEIVRFHQEKFDGTGYPDGLKGEDIPLGSRVAAVVDAYDAMTSVRPYRKKAMTPQEAIEELDRCAGTQFDPVVVEAMKELYNEGML